jgi:GNAT superfamily N-acetyltransferase
MTDRRNGGGERHEGAVEASRAGRPSVIERLYVLPDARRHGVASAPLAATLEWSREQRCPSVFVTFRREDDETHALTDFYARRGFDIVGGTMLARRLS